MNIIVVGCGRVGAELAYRLFENGHNVTVIDKTAANFNNLNPRFRGRTVEGEALNEDVLHRAGIEMADGLAAVTPSDTVNAVVGHTARSVYGLRSVIVRNYNPRRRKLVEAFGLQMISSTSWGAQRIEEMLYHGEIRTVFSAGNGEVEVYEFSVPQSWEGLPMRELLSDEESSPVALTRAGQALFPSPELTLKNGDVLLVSATLKGIVALRSRVIQVGEM